MNERRFYCTSPERLRVAARTIAAMPVSEKHALEVVVREPRREKTVDQRRLWHALCAEAAPSLGLTPNEVKQMLKCEFFGVERRTVGSHSYEFVQSSEDSDRDEYSRLIEFSHQFLAAQGVMVRESRRG